MQRFLDQEDTVFIGSLLLIRLTIAFHLGISNVNNA